MCQRIQRRGLFGDLTEAQKDTEAIVSFSPEALDQGDESTRLL